MPAREGGETARQRKNTGAAGRGRKWTDKEKEEQGKDLGLEGGRGEARVIECSIGRTWGLGTFFGWVRGEGASGQVS